MAKFSGFGEQYDGGRDIFIEQEGTHITISVECQQGANAGTALVTPGQARMISTALLEVAESADKYGGDL